MKLPIFIIFISFSIITFTIPTGNPLAGQRLAVEFIRPIYQNLTGTQLKTTWGLTVGWQYAFHL